jgi:hypothetical protein
MTKKSTGYMTMAEHHAEMKANGTYDAYVERGRKHQEELDKRSAARRAALEPLEEDLRAAGAPSLSALSSQTPPPNVYKAIPILLAHLPKNYPADARNRIAMALQKPEARAHWHALTALYRGEPDENMKGQLACNISVIADAAVLGDVIALVRDTAQGQSRAALLSVLEKTKDPRGRATIEELADDPELREEIKEIRKRWARNALKRAERQARKNPTRH